MDTIFAYQSVNRLETNTYTHKNGEWEKNLCGSESNMKTNAKKKKNDYRRAKWPRNRVENDFRLMIISSIH